jgi:putative ABC transport system ATP-binding protein
MSQDTSMIEIRNLQFDYGDGGFSLGIPGFDVASGETIAMVGASGCGKTTLLNLIAGISHPAKGRISVDGIDLETMSDVELREHRVTRIGLVFQEFELLEYLDVFDNILLPFRINGALKLTNGARERAAELAERVGISGKLNRYPGHLSQGERQRAAVCRALMTEPALLLADEPTGNLDPDNKSRVLDILFDYASDRGATLIAVTHDHELVPRFSRSIDFKSFADSSKTSLTESS